ncbi:GIY-YIG nuclease family protein [Sphingomonas pruni]|uniref:GIY-YIG nuclease family protein n=1 Tax=Sphingomonas pruni TaxID=40683 RepID=UPI0008355205|nr:GIY-YIG nuclease family protein [Sphingomonas pruni]
MADLDLDELRAELDDFAQPQPKRSTYTPLEERIIAGFEDIIRFREERGRAPLHGEDRDIFERLYAVRLDRLRARLDSRALLADLDSYGLLDTPVEQAQAEPEELDPDELMAQLEGIEATGDITKLRHVQTREERRAAEEIANRERCADFDRFKPLFQQVEHDLGSGVRETRPFVKDAGFSKAEISPGQFFILGGQIAYVAEMGDPIRAPNGETDARLRVIYSNATESDLLLRSLQRALYKDEAGRRITEPSAGPLFQDQADEDDSESGTIYVLRSNSTHPLVTEHRKVLHKIGVTGGSVEARLAGVEKDATYLLAGVEVVSTYKLFNVNRRKLEAVIHKVFAPAQMDFTISDRFGNPVKPREWFLVPLAVIDEAVSRIRDGSITDFRYDPTEGRLVHV